MDFLERFQSKISTVTVHGNLQKADGSEEIRVGPKKIKRLNNKNIKQNITSSSSVSSHSKEPQDDDRYDSSQMIEPININNEKEKEKEKNKTVYIDQKKNITTQKKKKDIHPNEGKEIYKPPGPILSQMNPKDQLAFSKKARPVTYEPCTLSEYKKEVSDKYYELGKLQPDLNSQDLLTKRANHERIKLFSKQLREINKQSETSTSTTNNNHNNNKQQTSREKALAFAKTIAPPKHKSSFSTSIESNPLIDTNKINDRKNGNHSPIKNIKYPHTIQLNKKKENIKINHLNQTFDEYGDEEDEYMMDKHKIFNKEDTNDNTKLVELQLEHQRKKELVEAIRKGLN